MQLKHEPAAPRAKKSKHRFEYKPLTAIGMPGGRMHDHACGFVDDGNVVVFVDDRRGNFSIYDFCEDGFIFHEKISLRCILSSAEDRI